PVLARLLRARIEALIPSAYGSLATLLERYREQAKRRFTTIGLRRRFWENVIQGPIAELMLAGHREAAEKALQQSLDENESLTARGEVSLVGAGPGDPDLLTFRALRLLQRADVIVYDRLVSQAILDLARKDAEFVYVGKRRADHAVPQQGINQLLVDLAQQGKRVVRLKGGDPFIFGRGGEEIEELAQAGILFQIVPGITAAAGAASYSGIPLTHRDYAQSVVFVTGHLKDNTVDLDWGAIVRPNQTLVVYMGLVGLAQMCKQLVAHGMGEGTPIAIIEKATTQDQRVITGDLTDIVTKAEQHALRAPTLIIIGEVVRLHHTLRWFETEAATSV
ncbi:MAG: siroheme synthase CysG, partial [Gammaproteobacteria bacterium]|nr:siroheme synthase CysG [Gammaproteobacteria bacterium]